MRESPYLPPNTIRTVTQWAQAFAADPRDVAAAAARLGWNLGPATPTTLAKQTFIDEVLPAPTLAYLWPRVITPVEAMSGRVILHLFGRGFLEGSQVILDADAPVDEDDPDSGPRMAVVTQVLGPCELVCALAPTTVAGPYAVAVRTPERKDSNHLTLLITATAPPPEAPPGVTLPERGEWIQPLTGPAAVKDLPFP